MTSLVGKLLGAHNEAKCPYKECCSREKNEYVF